MGASPDGSAPKALELVPFVAVLSVGYVLFAPAAIPAALIDRFDVGYTAFGLLTSVPLLSVVLAQFASGHLTARYATTRVLLVATAAHVVLTIALEFARVFPTLLAFRAVWGLASGVVLTVGATHIARLHEGTKATYRQGFYGGALTFGGLIAFLVVPSLLDGGAPIGRYGPGAFIGVLASIACWRHRGERLTVPQRPPARGGEPNPAESTTSFDLLVHPVVVVAAFCYVASLGSYVTLSTFITAYFETIDVSGPLNVAVLLVATTGRAAGGIVAGRWDVHGWTLIAAATMTAVAGFGVLALTRSTVVLLLCPFVAMLAVSVPFGAIYGVTADATTKEGSALAIVIAVGNLAALLLPALTGAIRDATGEYGGAFVMLGVVNAVAAIGAVSLRRSAGSRT